METQKKQIQNDEDVLDFSLEDISLEDIDKEAAADDEEVIELMDLVERGEPIDADEKRETSGPLKGREPGDEDGDFDLSTEDLAGIEGALGDETKGAAELDTAEFALEEELPAEAAQSSAVSEKDLDGLLKEAEAQPAEPARSLESLDKDLDELLKQVKEEPPEEQKMDLLDELPEDLPKKGEVSFLGVSPEKEASEPLPRAEGAAIAPEPTAVGISQEKLEAVVAKEVQESMERAIQDRLGGVVESAIQKVVPDVLSRAVPIAVDRVVPNVMGGAVQDAVENVLPDALGRAVQDAVERVVPGAVQSAVEKAVQDVLGRVVQDTLEKVVREVHEKVARGAVESVSERVISEAIESLKKSLSETP